MDDDDDDDDDDECSFIIARTVKKKSGVVVVVKMVKMVKISCFHFSCFFALRRNALILLID